MPVSGAAAPTPSRLHRLLAFLERDPANLALISEAAGAAIDEGRPQQALDLVERYAALARPPHDMLGLKGVALMEAKRFEEAAALFEGLLSTTPNDAALRFNLAWCLAMMKEYERSSDQLDEAAIDSAAAAQLKIQMLHHLGRLPEALTLGARLAERFPDATGLMGSLSALAVDAEDEALAERYGRRAGLSPDGITTLGMLSFNADRPDEALGYFDQALAQRPADARAHLGKGLALLLKGDLDQAPGHIDQAAEAFGDHLGSWVAAGWAQFARGDYAAARARFERALQEDDTFSEGHGGLAVLDVMEGNLASAKRSAEVAKRLDRASFGAALATTLLLSHQGDQKSAERVRDIALSTPVSPGGRTIGQAIAALGRLKGR